jgi:uncharacterized protein YhaN
MKKDYQTILLEQIRDQNKAILEGLEDVPKRVEFNRLEQKVDKLSEDIEVVSAAVKATNRDLAEVKREVQVSELKIHDILRDLDEHVHLPAHGGEMLKS